MIAWLALVGCAPGPAEESLVEDLRVLAVTADPPEIAPGGTTSVAITVADPAGDGVETLAWTCTDLGEGCLEAASPPGAWLTVGAEPTSEVTVADVALPDAAPFAAVELWTLACAPGVCPAVAEAGDAIATGALGDDLASGLADPASWLVDLPMRGVSLARRTIVVSDRPPDARNANPTVEVAAPDGLSAGETATVTITAADPDDDALTAWVYATAGGFERPDLPVDGAADVVLYAPDARGEVRLWVVVDDGRGGSAVWSGAVPVE